MVDFNKSIVMNLRIPEEESKADGALHVEGGPGGAATNCIDLSTPEGMEEAISKLKFSQEPIAEYLAGKEQSGADAQPAAGKLKHVGEWTAQSTAEQPCTDITVPLGEYVGTNALESKDGVLPNRHGGATIPSGKKITFPGMSIADLRRQYNNLFQPAPILKNVSDTFGVDPAKEGSRENYVAWGPFPQASAERIAELKKSTLSYNAALTSEDRAELCTVRDVVKVMMRRGKSEMELFYTDGEGRKINVELQITSVKPGS